MEAKLQNTASKLLDYVGSSIMQGKSVLRFWVCGFISTTKNCQKAITTVNLGGKGYFEIFFRLALPLHYGIEKFLLHEKIWPNLV